MIAPAGQADAQYPTVKEMAGWAFSALRERKHGETLMYPELTSILTMDATSRRGRAAILRAGRRLLKEEDRLLVNVRGIGYQVAQPNEHADQSQRKQNAARRRLSLALAYTIHCDWNKLTPEEQQKLLTVQSRAALKVAFGERMDRQKALPPRDHIAMPKGRELVSLITRKKPEELRSS